MPRELSSEYDIDPREYLDRIEDIVTDRHPPTKVRNIDKVLFADGGPVDYLVWFVLDDYDEHRFFYYDDTPDSKMLQQLLSTTPTEEEMPKFRVLLQSHYETVEVVESAALFEIPDTYLPQFSPKPRANIGFFYSPVDDAIAVGTSAVPRSKTERILEDMEKILPNRSVERFTNDVVQELYSEIEAEIKRHVLEADVRPMLEADSGFKYETMTAIPEDIHPEYAGQDGELWQKPVSKVSYLDGAQGFLQIWLPEDAEDLALVTVTSGEYDKEKVIEETRNHLQQSLQKRSA
jgi:hypothetical protein